MSAFTLDESAIRTVVEEVLRGLGRNGAPSSNGAAPTAPAIVTPRAPAGRFGVFTDVAAAAAAAQGAFLQLQQAGLAGRAKIIDIVKDLATRNAAEWGRIEFEETKIGRLAHKVEKLQIVKLVPGLEWLRPYALSGDHGITLEECTPFGVIGAITPVTHSVPTICGNIISMVAAGNSIVVNPHPGGARCAAIAVRAINEAIHAATGIEHLVTIIAEPSLETFDALCKDQNIRLLCVTGGPGVVNAAMKSGKRAICAGPGNPPVVVDGTGSLAKAAADTLSGAAYDNNLLCVGEKQVFVLEHIADRFMTELAAAGAAKLNSTQLTALTAAAFTTGKDAGGCSHPVLNRKLVGVDAAVLARHAGATVSADTPLLFAETDANHPFVVEEQMMPMIPIVRVKTFDEAVTLAAKSEHGYRHSAIIHSLNVEHMTQMARALDTTVFVKNGPSTAGLGLGGEGYLNYSIATTTGEGIATPRTFTRTRRCVMVDNLRIY
ncbi:aldehyde dehydrogenase family protein [Opitutaceae bacterium TAV4]|nr:aldehyde dehydrogenase family protein [Opitutaceae bacterium TAV4]RRJ99587.1 aldehyde dehydrogenase family protein [Opitutaceae bacterium TAV3]